MFQCRTRHSVWCNVAIINIKANAACFNAARGILWCNIDSSICPFQELVFQCRTRHSVWCNARAYRESRRHPCFNAARGILCGAITYRALPCSEEKLFQCRTRHSVWCNYNINLDHQEHLVFQCRTRHSVWCNIMAGMEEKVDEGFNAARGILCGAMPDTAR